MKTLIFVLSAATLMSADLADWNYRKLMRGEVQHKRKPSQRQVRKLRRRTNQHP